MTRERVLTWLVFALLAAELVAFTVGALRARGGLP